MDNRAHLLVGYSRADGVKGRVCLSVLNHLLRVIYEDVGFHA